MRPDQLNGTSRAEKMQSSYNAETFRRQEPVSELNPNLAGHLLASHRASPCGYAWCFHRAAGHLAVLAYRIDDAPISACAGRA
jgi:hypothetical protein